MSYVIPLTLYVIYLIPCGIHEYGGEKEREREREVTSSCESKQEKLINLERELRL